MAVTAVFCRYGWYGSTRGAALTVRTMANVYNYDYLFDHIFYLEGSVEVRMAASGYLQVREVYAHNSGAYQYSFPRQHIGTQGKMITEQEYMRRPWVRYTLTSSTTKSTLMVSAL